jgi:hypothetical protein
MKKLTLALSLALLASAGLTTDAMAQRYDTRIEIPGVVNIERDYGRGGRGGRGGDWAGRTARDLERLNYEVRQVRMEIGDLRDGRIRDRFRRVRRAADQLNYAFEERAMPGWEIRRRAEDIRAELNWIRRELRMRYGGPRMWR